MNWRPFSCKMGGGNCASLERIFSVSLSSQRLWARQNARTKAATRLAGEGLEQSSLLHHLVLGGVSPVKPASSYLYLRSSATKHSRPCFLPIFLGRPR